VLVNIAVVFYVADPELAAGFLRRAFDFETTVRDQSLCSSNGAIAIVFEQGEGTAPRLELQCDDLATEVQRLLAMDGIVEAPAPKNTHTPPPRDRLECLLDAECGLKLMLFQQLDEDDLGDLLPLPASLPWDAKADELVRELLRLVPVWVRDGARRRATEHAEYLTVESGRLDVCVQTALKAFVACTLPSHRESLYAGMTRMGLNPTPYRIDEDA